MQVFDEITGKKLLGPYREVVVKHTPNQLIFGYVSSKRDLIPAFFEVNGELVRFITCAELLGDQLFYSNYRGCYMSKVGISKKDIDSNQFRLGQDRFPYSFGRRYEAVENFDLFKGKQVLENEMKFDLGNLMPYTFGIEFETSQGYVPEDRCFKDGLIPLRDGSISGLEYSTVVLSGNEGLSFLHQQIKDLSKYTFFNKECSLHIHFGGFPLEPNKIFNLYCICRGLEPTIQTLVPSYTFESGRYKDNGKNYCNRLPQYRNFNQMYEHLVGRKFFGDFTQPHPNDVERKRKWQIPTRYYSVNFINALCYNVNKTIEFRFLRPTYNFEKILIWMYIFNAILKYAETTQYSSGCSLEKIIKSIYPKQISSYVLDGVSKLAILKYNQENNGDYIGRDTSLEDRLFKNI